MIDLGKYTTTVLSAYGVSLFFLGAIVFLTIRKNAAARDRLKKLEAKSRD